MAEKWTRDREIERTKIEHRREGSNEYINFLKKQNLQIEEFMEHFPAYVGHMALNRVLTIYEIYQKSLGLAGHIADVGVYRGGQACYLLN